MLRTAGIVIAALVVAVVIWLSVAADWVTLWHGAGLWTLVAVAFPAFIAFGVWRNWGD